MNIYIFEDVDQLTTNYHCEGGLVVVAKNEKHVNELIQIENKTVNEYDWQEAAIELTEEEWEKVKVYPLAEEVEPKVMIFPNAGCC